MFYASLSNEIKLLFFNIFFFDFYSNALYLEMLLHWVKAYNKFLGLIVTSFNEVSMSEPYWHRQPVAMIVMLLYLLCHDSKFQPMRNEH